MDEKLICDVSQEIVNAFQCGDDGIDNYFHQKAQKDYADGATVTHVICFPGEDRICGMYSLKASALLFTPTTKRSAIPVFEIYMFAVDQFFQGKTIETNDEEKSFEEPISDFLLYHALGNCELVSENYLAANAVIANSLNTKRAINLYVRNGFEDISEYMEYIPAPEDTKGTSDSCVFLRRF